jgi:hypothetical protein
MRKPDDIYFDTLGARELAPFSASASGLFFLSPMRYLSLI